MKTASVLFSFKKQNGLALQSTTRVKKDFSVSIGRSQTIFTDTYLMPAAVSAAVLVKSMKAICLSVMDSISWLKNLIISR